MAKETEVLERREPLKASEALSASAALAQLKANRGGAEQPATNPVSEAARTLALSKKPAAAQPAVKAIKPITAPEQDKPADEAEETAVEEAAPEGQDATEEQPEADANDTAVDDEGWIGDGDDAKIILDGQEITKKEFRDSYLRRDDYTRKTQALAERGRVLDQTLNVVTQNSQRVEQLVGLLEQAVGQEPDWGTLALQMQPQQYLAYKENWTAQKNALNNARSQQSQAVQAAIQQAKSVMLEEASRTFKPEWQDRAKMQEGLTKLGEFALSKGITPDELKILHRAPMLEILDMAFELQTIKSTQRITDKKVQNKPKPVRPGSQRQPGNQALNDLEQARATWESNKRPDTKAARAWLQAKADYEQRTGKRA